MQINYAHLCDYALLSKDGKLSILGIFDRIQPAQLPFALPQSFLAFEIELNYAEVGKEFEAKIECVDADGNPLFGAQSKIQVNPASGKRPKVGDNPRLPQVIGLTNLVVNRVGEHNINFWLQGKLSHQLRFEVVRAEQTPPPPLPGKR